MTGKNLKTPLMEKKTKLKINSRKGKSHHNGPPIQKELMVHATFICGEVNLHQKQPLHSLLDLQFKFKHINKKNN